MPGEKYGAADRLQLIATNGARHRATIPFGDDLPETCPGQPASRGEKIEMPTVAVELVKMLVPVSVPSGELRTTLHQPASTHLRI
jgi:hypothetical protein